MPIPSLSHHIDSLLKPKMALGACEGRAAA